MDLHPRLNYVQLLINAITDELLKIERALSEGQLVNLESHLRQKKRVLLDHLDTIMKCNREYMNIMLVASDQPRYNELKRRISNLETDIMSQRLFFEDFINTKNVICGHVHSSDTCILCYVYFRDIPFLPFREQPL
jgi:hypothetical protein